MSRPALFLLVSIRREKAPIRFAWPIPLFIAWMLLDAALDLADLMVLFAPAKSLSFRFRGGGEVQWPLRTVRAVVRDVAGALRESLLISEAWELVRVETESVRVRLSIV